MTAGLTPARTLDLNRVDVERIVEVDGRPGLFTPLTGVDPADPPSVENLTKVVAVLRDEVARLQSENATLTARLADADTPARSPDDFAAGVQHSLDVLAGRLSAMDNPVSNFAVREFHLETKVHVDVTPVGTVGYRFVQPGQDLDPALLSTLSLTVVPVPRPVSDDASPAVLPGSEVGVEAIDGLTDDQVAKLRSSYITTTAAFQQAATRATTSASLVSLLGIDRDTLGRYTLLAGLLAVPGLDRRSAAILADAGITDVASLAAAEPAALAKRYAAAAKRRPDDDGVRPDAKAVAAWVDAAKRMVGAG